MHQEIGILYVIIDPKQPMLNNHPPPITHNIQNPILIHHPIPHSKTITKTILSPNILNKHLNKISINRFYFLSINSNKIDTF